MRLLDEYPNAAVILLDVVMEDKTSGLAVVHHIRKFLRNPRIRIILRTGQPKPAPVDEIVSEYDINDYKEKNDLTAQKLITCLSTSLQAYYEITELAQLASNTEE